MAGNEDDRNGIQSANGINCIENETTRETPRFRYQIMDSAEPGTNMFFKDRISKLKNVNKPFCFAGVLVFVFAIVVLSAHLFVRLSKTEDKLMKITNDFENFRQQAGLWRKHAKLTSATSLGHDECGCNITATRDIRELSLQLNECLNDHQLILERIQKNSSKMMKEMGELKDKLNSLAYNSSFSDKKIQAVIENIIRHSDTSANKTMQKDHKDILKKAQAIHKQCGNITNYINNSDKKLIDRDLNESQASLLTLGVYEDELACLVNKTSAAEMPSASCLKECDSINLVNNKYGKRNEGAVEVTYQGEKWSLCSENRYNVYVICRMLGYPQGGIEMYGGQYIDNVSYRSPSKKLWLRTCKGNERGISQCTFAPRNKSCSIAGVRCIGTRNANSDTHININILEHLHDESASFKKQLVKRQMELTSFRRQRFARFYDSVSNAEREIDNIEKNIQDLQLKSTVSIITSEYDHNEQSAMLEMAENLQKNLTKIKSRVKELVTNRNKSIDNEHIARLDFLKQHKTNIDCLKSDTCGLCSNKRICSHITLHLSNHTNKSVKEGTVTVTHNGTERLLCPSQFLDGNNSVNTALVVCKMMGYSSGGIVTSINTRPINTYYTDVQVFESKPCSGTERDISDCHGTNNSGSNSRHYCPKVRCEGEIDLSDVCN